MMRRYWYLTGLLTLSACSLQTADGPPTRPLDVSRIADAVPRYEPRSRSANPESYQVAGHRYRVLKSASGYVERGIASWYGRKFHGRPTASGEPYDMYAMTAAHRTLPIPSYVEVTNLRNGRKVVVRVNDRGPFHRERIIDLSYAAAVKLGLDKSGTAPVEVRAITPTKGSGKAFLQLGAFTDKANAERLLAQLQAYRVSRVWIENTRRQGRVYYRVRVGPLTSRSQVDKLTRRLHRLGIHPTLVND